MFCTPRFSVGHKTKMHITNKDYLTKGEWEYVKKLAIDNYPEYNWEKGGYGNYEQFNFVRDDK